MLENTAKAEANATAGLVNVTKPSMTVSPTLNFQTASGTSGKKPFPQRYLEGIAQAKDPVGYAAKQAEALAIRSKALADACELYRTTFPTFNDNQICLLAFGYSMTASEANNIADVLCRAADKLPEDADPSALPAECIDEDIKGAATAYEEELREMWSSLIAEEVESGSPFGRRSKHVLGEMTSRDAHAFKMLCSYSPWTQVGRDQKMTPIPILTQEEGETWTYNKGTLLVEDVSLFASWGLIEKGSWVSFTLKGKSAQPFFIGDYYLLACGTKESDEKQTLGFGDAMFLSPGIELASICDAEPAELLPEFARLKASDFNITWRRRGMAR